MTAPQQQTYPGGLGYYAQADAERQASARQQQGSQIEQMKQQLAQQVQGYAQQRDQEYEQARQQIEAQKAALSRGLTGEGQQVQQMQQRYQNPNVANYAPQPMPQQWPAPQYAQGGQVLPRYEGGGGYDPLRPAQAPSSRGNVYIVQQPSGVFAAVDSRSGAVLYTSQSSAGAQQWAANNGYTTGAPTGAGPIAGPAAGEGAANVAGYIAASTGAPAPAARPAAPAAAPQPPRVGGASAVAPVAAQAPAQATQTAASASADEGGAPQPPATLTGSVQYGGVEQTPIASGRAGTNTFQTPLGYTVVQYGGGYHSVYAPDGSFYGNFRDSNTHSPADPSFQAGAGPGSTAPAAQFGGMENAAAAPQGAPQPPSHVDMNAGTGPKQTTLADGSTVLTYDAGAHWVNSPTTGWHWYAGDDQSSPVNSGQSASTAAPQPPAFTPDPAYQAALDARKKAADDEAKAEARQRSFDENRGGMERTPMTRYAAGGMAAPPLPPAGMEAPPTAIIGEKDIPGPGYRLELMIPKALLSQLTYTDRPTGAPLPEGMAIVPVAPDAKPAIAVIKAQVPMQAGVPATKKGGTWQVEGTGAPQPPKMTTKKKVPSSA